MLIQFKALIVSIFMAVSNLTSPPAINIDNIDNLRELSCLSQAVHGEAANQSLKGKIAVAFVILNRTKDSSFPSDVCSVINQKGQFDFLRKVKKINEDNPLIKAQMEEVVKASWMVMNDEVPDPTHGALYFINPKYCTDKVWLKNFKKLVKIESHVFYTRKA